MSSSRGAACSIQAEGQTEASPFGGSPPSGTGSPPRAEGRIRTRGPEMERVFAGRGGREGFPLALRVQGLASRIGRAGLMRMSWGGTMLLMRSQLHGNRRAQLSETGGGTTSERRRSSSSSERERRSCRWCPAMHGGGNRRWTAAKPLEVFFGENVVDFVF